MASSWRSQFFTFWRTCATFLPPNHSLILQRQHRGGGPHLRYYPKEAEMVVEERVKILVLGPAKAGKTCLADYLSNFKDTPSSSYKETVGVRILDYEPEGLNLPGRSVKVVVELWDVSGNHRYQSCWPAVAHEANGIIYVFNIDQKTQLAELELWHKTFSSPQGVLGQETPHIKDDMCLVFAHRSSPPHGNIKAQKPRLTGKLQDIRCLATSLDYSAETNWKGEFDKLITHIVLAKRQEEENAFLNSGMDGPLPVQSSK
eukprot:TRINITY_DN8132_c0_g1_i2.p1 TRINITY_DN8132_c0_g1~~TRINITY_DN8132_c0_g1_i2.p1  ORF type:complete len:259 (+),score=45.00 TRINITY_DN8132_c0_g1_i2:403-1179(+)